MSAAVAPTPVLRRFGLAEEHEAWEALLGRVTGAAGGVLVALALCLALGEGEATLRHAAWTLGGLAVGLHALLSMQEPTRDLCNHPRDTALLALATVLLQSLCSATISALLLALCAASMALLLMTARRVDAVQLISRLTTKEVLWLPHPPRVVLGALLDPAIMASTVPGLRKRPAIQDPARTRGLTALPPVLVDPAEEHTDTDAKGTPSLCAWRRRAQHEQWVQLRYASLGQWRLHGGAGSHSGPMRLHQRWGVWAAVPDSGSGSGSGTGTSAVGVAPATRPGQPVWGLSSALYAPAAQKEAGFGPCVGLETCLLAPDQEGRGTVVTRLARTEPQAQAGLLRLAADLLLRGLGLASTTVAAAAVGGWGVDLCALAGALQTASGVDTARFHALATHAPQPSVEAGELVTPVSTSAAAAAPETTLRRASSAHAALATPSAAAPVLHPAPLRRSESALEPPRATARPSSSQMLRKATAVAEALHRAQTAVACAGAGPGDAAEPPSRRSARMRKSESVAAVLQLHVAGPVAPTAAAATRAQTQTQTLGRSHSSACASESPRRPSPSSPSATPNPGTGTPPLPPPPQKPPQPPPPPPNGLKPQASPGWEHRLPRLSLETATPKATQRLSFSAAAAAREGKDYGVQEPTPVPLSVSSAQYLRAAKASVRRVLQMADATEADGWEYLGPKSGVKLYRKEDDSGSGLMMIKGAGVVNAPADLVLRFIWDLRRKASYDSMFNPQSRVLKIISPDCKLAHQMYLSIPFIKERDFCVVSHRTRMADGTRVLAATSVEYAHCPPQKSHVRAKIISGGFVVRPRDAQRCSVTMVGLTDLCGSLPTKIKNAVGERQPMLIHAIDKALKKLDLAQLQAELERSEMQERHGLLM